MLEPICEVGVEKTQDTKFIGWQFRTTSAHPVERQFAVGEKSTPAKLLNQIAFPV